MLSLHNKEKEKMKCSWLWRHFPPRFCHTGHCTDPYLNLKTGSPRAAGAATVNGHNEDVGGRPLAPRLCTSTQGLAPPQFGLLAIFGGPPHYIMCSTLVPSTSIVVAAAPHRPAQHALRVPAAWLPCARDFPDRGWAAPFSVYCSVGGAALTPDNTAHTDLRAVAA